MYINVCSLSRALKPSNGVAGGQEMSYRKCIKNDLELFYVNKNKDNTKMDFVKLYALARDRNVWRDRFLFSRLGT